MCKKVMNNVFENISRKNSESLVYLWFPLTKVAGL